MPTIKIDRFKGRIPRISDKLLPVDYSVKAEGVNLCQGNLKAMRMGVFADMGSVSIDNIDSSPATLFRATGNYNIRGDKTSIFYWWPFDVDAVQGQRLNDLTRIFYSGDGKATDPVHVDYVRIDSPGSGFPDTGSVSVSDHKDGEGFAARFFAENGGITSVFVDNPGKGYTQPPDLDISAYGAGGLLTAVLARSRWPKQTLIRVDDRDLSPSLVTPVHGTPCYPYYRRLGILPPKEAPTYEKGVMNFKWVENRDYEKDDIAVKYHYINYYADVYYKCIQSHTSSADKNEPPGQRELDEDTVFAEGTKGEDWEKFWVEFYVSYWSADVEYGKGIIVTFADAGGSKEFICEKDHVSSDINRPGNDIDWADYWEQKGYANWLEGISYNEFDVVRYAANTEYPYFFVKESQSHTSSTSNAPPASGSENTYWKGISVSSGDDSNIWSEYHGTYSENDFTATAVMDGDVIVSYDIYRCIQAYEPTPLEPVKPGVDVVWWEYWSQYYFEVMDRASYVYTYVTDWGGESAPSPPTDLITVYGHEYVILSNFAVPSPELNNLSDNAVFEDQGDVISHIRVYRLNAGSDGSSAYYKVKLYDINETSHDDIPVGAFYENGPETLMGDANLMNRNMKIALSLDLGEPLPTKGMIPPPEYYYDSDGNPVLSRFSSHDQSKTEYIKGVTQFSSGVLCGFIKDEVWFSEPGIPYAWPTEYKIKFDYNVVSLGALNNMLVVLTEGYPYVVTGTYPEALSFQKIPVKQKCISKRGVAVTEDKVIFPSPEGLYAIGPAGSGLLSADTVTKEQWIRMIDEGISGFYYEGLYTGFREGSPEIFFVNLSESPPTLDTVVMDAEYAFLSGSVSVEDDALYLMMSYDAGSAVTHQVIKWNRFAGPPFEYTWRSKTFVFPAPVSFTGIRLISGWDEEWKENDAPYPPWSVVARNGVVYRANGFWVDANEILRPGDGTGDWQSCWSVCPDVRFTIYADNEARDTGALASGKTLRLSGGYKASLWAVELSGYKTTDEVILTTSVSELRSLSGL